MPPLVGWAAATGGLTLDALWPFAIVFLWTPPHFWALVAADQGRLRAHRRPDAAGRPRRGRHAPPDPRSTRCVLVAFTLAARRHRPLRRRSTCVAALAARRRLRRPRRAPAAAPLAARPRCRLYLSSLAYLALLFCAMAAGPHDRLILAGCQRAERPPAKVRRSMAEVAASPVDPDLDDAEQAVRGAARARGAGGRRRVACRLGLPGADLPDPAGGVHHLPDALGLRRRSPSGGPFPFSRSPAWSPRLRSSRLPGRGGHVPARGLNAAPTQPIELPGVILAALASIGLGHVLGPEAPLIALGGGLGLLAVRLLRGDAPPEVGDPLAAAGTFAALSFLFGSPLIAAVHPDRGGGLGRSEAAAGAGSRACSRRASGRWSRSGWDRGPGSAPAHISLGASAAARLRPSRRRRLRSGRSRWPSPSPWSPSRSSGSRGRPSAWRWPRPFLLFPRSGLLVAGLAIAFSETTGKGVERGAVLRPGRAARAGRRAPGHGRSPRWRC